MSESYYEFITTDDNSPTVRWHHSDGRQESMHSHKGALTESLYIYQQAIGHTLSQEWTPTVLSVGMGIGYCELIAAAELVDAPHSTREAFYMESFESEELLRDNFRKWVCDEELATEWQSLYDQIATLIASRSTATELKAQLRQWLTNGQWKVREALTADTPFDRTFSCVFYDAYCAKTSPDLWDENNINLFLKNSTNNPCVLSTYAATGTLKRALKSSGFELHKREGFAGKRESTWATKTESKTKGEL